LLKAARGRAAAGGAQLLLVGVDADRAATSGGVQRSRSGQRWHQRAKLACLTR
jgi:hypothetical protein